MKSKLGSMVLSLVIAFGLWAYVITEVEPGSDRTYYDIPLTVVGETVLNDNNLMITNWSAKSVDLRLEGNRTDLNEVNEANIILKVDLARIYEPGVHRIDYTTSYPGSVASNAFTKLSQYPEYITVTVERRETKEVPIIIDYGETEVAENYMPRTSEVVLDANSITVKGPSSVVEQIEQAVIQVDLTERKESISENYRYTLCDAEGNPVDSEMITVNMEEVHLDLIIHRFKWVTLDVTIVDGGGATRDDVDLVVEPEQILLTGSDAAMEQVGDTLSLGTVNLVEYTEDTVLNFPIPSFDGVTNESNVEEATVDMKFKGLKIMEFTVEDIQVANVPDGYEAVIAAKQLTIKVRGPAAIVKRLTPDMIVATVDFSKAKAGTDTYRVKISFKEGFSDAGVLGKPTVSATIQELVPETTQEPAE